MRNINFNKSKLKIGIVIDQLLAGGVQLSAIEQVKELNRLGHDAKLVILMRKKYPTDFSYLVKGISYQYLSDSYPAFLSKTIKFPIFSFLSTLHLMSPILAPRVIKSNDYDAFVSLGTTTCLTTQAIYRAHKIPYIAVIHDPIEYILKKAYSKTILRLFFPILNPIAAYFERSFVLDAKKTIIISKVHYKYLKNKYNINPIIHTFGAKTLNKLPKKRGDKLISFGRWQNEKNPYFLLKLMKELNKASLIIAGSWNDKKELASFKKKIKDDNLQSRIELITSYDENKIQKLCADSRLFLHPHFEAFGLAALEAAGQGLPIIIPKRSGVTEIFRHGKHGFFPSRVDINQYLNFINKLLRDEKLAFTMGSKAWYTVSQNFSWEANVKQLLNLIYEIVPLEPRIYVLELSHALGAPLAGGDKLMEPMAIRLVDKYKFSIIVSSVGAKHWQDAPFNKELLTLNRNMFDESGKPIQVFLAYCIRMWQTFNILKKILKNHDNSSLILYSSTNILPDVLPAYLIKRSNPSFRWIGRVHHLIPPPRKRKGKIFINTISYLMQNVSLQMMRSKANITLALNDNLKKDLQEKGFKKSKLKVLGGGIEFENIANTKSNSTNKYNAVFLGRLHVTKGIFDTIPIWKEVVRKIPNAKLAIIGDGPEDLKDSLRQKIKSEQLNNNIFILGFLPYKKVYKIMKASDLFLFLDHEAGWGLAVAEAMACGLPVVGYDNGILGSVYKNGYIIAPVDNYTTFSSHVLKLLNSKTLRNTLSKKAYLEAAKHDWNMTSKSFSYLLDKEVLQHG